MEILLTLAVIPVLIELIIYFAFYISRHVKGFSGHRLAFKALTRAAGAIEDCKKENLAILEENIPEKAHILFKSSWENMKSEIDNHYPGSFIPEGEAFFPAEDFLERKALASGRRNILHSFLILSVIAFILPYLYTVFFDPYYIVRFVYVAGIISFLCGGVLFLLFTLADASASTRAERQYSHFIAAFNRVIPTASREAAFIFEVSRKDREAMAQAVETIEDRFDKFSKEDILPVLISSIETMTEKQEKGMADLAGNFSKDLTDTLDIRMSALASSIGEVQKGLMEMQESLKSNIYSIEELISGQISILENSATGLIRAEKAREEGAKTAEDALKEFTASNISLKETFENLNLAVEKISEENRAFARESSGLVNNMEELGRKMSHELAQSHQGLKGAIGESSESLAEISRQLKFDFMESGHELIDGIRDISKEGFALVANLKEESYRSQFRLAEGLEESQAKLVAAVDEAVRIFDGFGGKLKEAMGAAGSEISQGIRDATGDNAQAIEDLTEQASRLREDYDSYFTRIDEYSKTTYEELDYHIQSIIARISDEIGELMRTGSEENRAILDDYRSGTTNLLTSFNEQAESINLYAKEINMDIGELTENLRNSVAEFNLSLNESVRLSMNEFDTGLGELTLRLANTVESIRDAVEALPQTLKDRG